MSHWDYCCERFVLGDATVVSVGVAKGVTVVSMMPSMGEFKVGHCVPKTLTSELKLCADRYDAEMWLSALTGSLSMR